MPTLRSQKSLTDDAIRCAVFSTVEGAERAVTGLLDAGFHREQISVLCSDEAKERHFRSFEHEDPSGSHTPESAAVGGIIGATLGGLVSAGIATAAGLSILAAGPGLIVAGGVFGGLIGAMRTRGEEKSLADFYDQSLTEGKLLVGVEDRDPGNAQRLARADEVFREAGADPVPLHAER